MAERERVIAYRTGQVKQVNCRGCKGAIAVGKQRYSSISNNEISSSGQMGRLDERWSRSSGESYRNGYAGEHVVLAHHRYYYCTPMFTGGYTTIKSQRLMRTLLAR